MLRHGVYVASEYQGKCDDDPDGLVGRSTVSSAARVQPTSIRLLISCCLHC